MAPSRTNSRGLAKSKFLKCAHESTGLPGAQHSISKLAASSSARSYGEENTQTDKLVSKLRWSCCLVC